MQAVDSGLLVESVTVCWIGMHDPNGTGTWVWQDGTSVDYTR